LKPKENKNLKIKFEERKRIAEHLVRALREAGYSCDLGDNAASPPTLRRDD
jgi:hypothetical protein